MSRSLPLWCVHLIGRRQKRCGAQSEQGRYVFVRLATASVNINYPSSFMTYLSSFHIQISSSTIRAFASTIELGLEGPSLERFSKPRSIAGSAVQAADFLLKSLKSSKSPRRIMTTTRVVVQNLLSILYLPYLRTIMP